MARALGRFLQASGIVLAPMALLYYFQHRGTADESGLGTMEWMILASAVALFLLGRLVEK